MTAPSGATARRRPRVVMLLGNPYLPDVRVSKEARALAAAGHDVTVVAWDRSGEHPPDEAPHDGVRIVRLRGRDTGYGQGMKALVSGLPSFWRAALAEVPRLAPDVLHAHDFDQLPLAVALHARLRRTPIVFDAHENYPDYAAGKASAPGWLRPTLQAAERVLVPRAAAVVTVGPKLADHYAGIGARRVAVVGNWQEPDAFAFSAAELDAERAALGLTGFTGPVIAYVGVLGRNRAVHELLDAVEGREDVRVVLGGYGPMADDLAARCASLPNAQFLGTVPWDRNRRIKALADVVWRVIRTTENRPETRWAAPNNLFEALAAGSAIIATRNGEIPTVVEGEGCGVCVSPGAGVDELRAAIDTVCAPATLATMQANARRAGRERYSWPVAAERLVRVYAAVTPAT